jgi:hypothetical protein
MAHPYEALDDRALQWLLVGAATERGERFEIRQVGDRWEASFLSKVSMFGEVGTLSAGAPDRRAALIALADQVSRHG